MKCLVLIFFIYLFASVNCGFILDKIQKIRCTAHGLASKVISHGHLLEPCEEEHPVEGQYDTDRQRYGNGQYHYDGQQQQHGIEQQHYGTEGQHYAGQQYSNGQDQYGMGQKNYGMEQQGYGQRQGQNQYTPDQHHHQHNPEQASYGNNQHQQESLTEPSRQLGTDQRPQENSHNQYGTNDQQHGSEQSQRVPENSYGSSDQKQHAKSQPGTNQHGTEGNQEEVNQHHYGNKQQESTTEQVHVDTSKQPKSEVITFLDDDKHSGPKGKNKGNSGVNFKPMIDVRSDSKNPTSDSVGNTTPLIPIVDDRRIIDVKTNCPAGQKADVEGICREEY